MRSASGKYVPSSFAGGNGTSKPDTRSTGASRAKNAFSMTVAAISEPSEVNPGASCA
ncbi:hypothetical protein SRABI128_03530 [Microbacterium sp. Bi128]|nr:hypothetical protein SRABI128_03530 [Microbacterium sp. Bi128]